MNNRLYYFFHSIITLLVGLIIYIFLRNGTYLNKWLIEGYNLSFFADDFIRYSLPDFLWAYALSMILFAILKPKCNKRYLITICVSLLGVIWEAMQKVNLVSGTFDIIDCSMYIIAALIADLIFLKREFRK